MNKTFVCPNFTLEKEDIQQNYGCFGVEPLERGFGITLGNSIRRVLLSSIPGGAIYCLKIRGASHEFMNLKGVTEDCTEIILNVKGIVLQIKDDHFTDNEKIILNLKADEGIVTAGMINCPSGVEIINKDHYLATVSKNGSLEIEFYCRNSRGFDRCDENKKLIPSLGYIPIDSKYSPIQKVSYNVEPTKVGIAKDLEKLTLEITTNGSISPIDALAIAGRILTEHLQYFVDLNESVKKMEVISDVVKVEEDNLDLTLDKLEFTQRSSNCLKRAGINNLGDIARLSKDEVLSIRNLGKKSYKEIEEKLAFYGLTFSRN